MGRDVGRGQAIQCGGIVWRERISTGIVENPNKVFKATVHCHHFAGPMWKSDRLDVEWVERWQRGRRIQCWLSKKLIQLYHPNLLVL